VSVAAAHRPDVRARVHDLTLATQYADRMLLLDAGRVAAEGAPHEVMTEPLIARHYDATIEVLSVGGRFAVVPSRPATPVLQRTP